MVRLNALPTDATEPTPISEQEEGTLEDQLDAAMEQPVAEGLVVRVPAGFENSSGPPVGVPADTTPDDPPPVAEAACEETGEEPAKEEMSTLAAEAESKDAEKGPDEDHAAKLSMAKSVAADALLNWYQCQKDTKEAKKTLDWASECLKDLVDKGPEYLPLIDGLKPDQEKVKTVEYSPPLEKGQVRVRIIEMNLAPGEEGETLAAGAIVICRHDSDDVLVWFDSENTATYFVEEDRYEVIEDWPDDVAGAVLHVPPIQFGPPTGETDDAPAVDSNTNPVDPEAWRAVSIASALSGLTDKRLTLLHEEAVTMGDLEDFRAEISQGKKKWPKGIGPAAVTSIEEMILDWLKDNQ